MELAPGIVWKDKGVVAIDPAVAFPVILAKLGAPAELDQYWIEVARQCAKLEAQRAVRDADLWPENGTLVIHIESRKGQDGGQSWALADHPAGRGAMAADRGREARERYRHWRGEIPSGPARTPKPEPEPETDWELIRPRRRRFFFGSL
jgi:hypothetical protein